MSKLERKERKKERERNGTKLMMHMFIYGEYISTSLNDMTLHFGTGKAVDNGFGTLAA